MLCTDRWKPIHIIADKVQISFFLPVNSSVFRIKLKSSQARVVIFFLKKKQLIKMEAFSNLVEHKIVKTSIFTNLF